MSRCEICGRESEHLEHCLLCDRLVCEHCYNDYLGLCIYCEEEEDSSDYVTEEEEDMF